MIKVDNLHITISAIDCPNLHYEFDFSDFNNQHLAKECVRLFERKYEDGVSITYLSVLSTALSRYDNYLQMNNNSGIIHYTENERRGYFNHLNSLYNSDERVYSKNYINFLAYVPCHLCENKENDYEQANI
ncbi:MAG: hypothetical protein ACI4KE_05240 [Anaerovoracaceae bacterium]